MNRKEAIIFLKESFPIKEFFIKTKKQENEKFFIVVRKNKNDCVPIYFKFPINRKILFTMIDGIRRTFKKHNLNYDK